MQTSRESGRSQSMSSACLTTAVIRRMPISGVTTLSGMSWLRRSFQRIRSAGASRSQAALRIGDFLIAKMHARMKQNSVRVGLDIWSGGSGAYSTLGYFADPVLNTMLDSGSEEIVAILIHELAHQRVYIKDDSELSEAFASTVEEHGTTQWLERENDSAALERYQQRLQARAVFADLVAAQQSRLAAIYSGSAADADKRRAKAAAFAQMRADYEARRSAGLIHSGYDAWFDQELNNATLAAVATYRRWVPALQHRLATRGLDNFYLDVEALAELDADERSATLEAWDAAAIAAARRIVNQGGN